MESNQQLASKVNDIYVVNDYFITERTEDCPGVCPDEQQQGLAAILI